MTTISSQLILPISADGIASNARQDTINDVDEETGIYQNYLHYFDVNGFRRV